MSEWEGQVVGNPRSRVEMGVWRGQLRILGYPLRGRNRSRLPLRVERKLAPPPPNFGDLKSNPNAVTMRSTRSSWLGFRRGLSAWHAGSLKRFLAVLVALGDHFEAVRAAD